jgi:tRNA(fMet)-specific endonuclease VapC
MGLSYMHNTNICAALMKFAQRDAVGMLDAFADAVAISSIVFAELRYGMENSSHRSQNLAGLDRFVSMIEVLPFGALAAEHYGVIRTDLRRSGNMIGNNDLFIAAHARSAGLTLVPNNRREFDRVPGLKVENWLA